MSFNLPNKHKIQFEMLLMRNDVIDIIFMPIMNLIVFSMIVLDFVAIIYKETCMYIFDHFRLSRVKYLKIYMKLHV